MMKDTNEKPKLIHPLEFYLEHLTTINDIPLTHREIDVLACSLSRRNTKGIANFLSIAPKTVATHLYNATKRFGCSADRMMSIIETSDHFLPLKKYYQALLVNDLFKLTLEEIAKQIGNIHVPKKCTFVYWQKKPVFLESLENDLRNCGLLISHECRKNVQSFDPFVHEDSDDTYRIYFLQDTLWAKQQVPLVTQSIDKTGDTNIFFLTDRKTVGLSSQENFSFLPSNPHVWQSYYDSVYIILMKVLPEIDITEIFAKFEEEAHDLENSLTTQSASPAISENKDERYRRPFASKKRLLSPQFQYIYLLLGVICLGFVIFLGINDTIPSQYIRTTLFPNASFMHKNKAPLVIRSDLAIPSAPTFLNRPELIQDIYKQFENQRGESIQTVVLIGIGGAGKTTLAHQYASSQKLPVVWEINAETNENLRQSFENLARAFAQTEDELKVLRGIQDIKSLGEREERLINFIKEKLKILSPWLLIFDNVEQFVDIQRYFPYDSQNWGHGKVIITTRDMNIQQNRHINYSVFVGELTSDQKLTLFSKIMNKQETALLPPHQAKETQAFLEKLPSFPLDISVAAYYLKATNVPFETYLINLEENSKDFADIQKNLLEDAGYYTTNRYKIMSLSLQKLINTHKEFVGLLLLTSLIGTQDIPRKLLEINTNRTVVDNYIVHLKKYSLLVREPSNQTNRDSDISIHRSMQVICLDYLKKSLAPEEQRHSMQLIINALEKYVEAIKETQDYTKMKALISHCEFLLSHRSMLDETMRASVCCQLGVIFFYLSQFEKAKNLFEESLIIYKKHLKRNDRGFARVLLCLGNVYRKLDDNEKAKDFLEQSLGIYKIYHPDNHIGIIQTLVNLSTVYKNLGAHEKAKDLLGGSLKFQADQLPKNYVAHARILTHLGNAYRKLRDYDKARDFLMQSLTYYKKVYPTNHICIGWIYAYLGRVYYKMGCHEKAKDLLEKSLIIFKDNYTDNHIDVAWASVLLAKIYFKLDRYEIAKGLLEKSLNFYKKEFPENHISIARVVPLLANFYINIGNYDQARKLHTASLMAFESYYGKNHKKTVQLVKDISQIQSLQQG